MGSSAGKAGGLLGSTVGGPIGAAAGYLGGVTGPGQKLLGGMTGGNGQPAPYQYPVPNRPDMPTISNVFSGANANQYTLGQRSPVQFQSIQPQVNNTLNGIQLDRTGLNELQNEALGNSQNSPWMKNQLQQITAQRQQDLANSMQQGLGQTAQARTQLAMHGGLTGGSAERLAMSGAKNNLLAAQGVNQGAANNMLQAGQTAEQNRLQQLSQLPGAQVASLQPELDKAKMGIGVMSDEQARQLQNDTNNRSFANSVDQYNIGNKLGEMNNVRNAGMDAYNAQMQDWAAANQANAQMAANQPGTNTFKKLGDPLGIWGNNSAYQTFADPLSVGGGGGSGGGAFGGFFGGK